jgi:hypothetical protein
MQPKTSESAIGNFRFPCYQFVMKRTLALILCLEPGFAVAQTSPEVVMIAPNQPIFVTVPPDTSCGYALDNQLPIGPTILATWHEMDMMVAKNDDLPGLPLQPKNNFTLPELPRLLKENKINVAIGFCLKHPDSTVGIAAEFAYAYPAWSSLHGMFGN